jgi:two-component system, NtrC family, nitrogen regulation sensor histidine kinase NtrY
MRIIQGGFGRPDARLATGPEDQMATIDDTGVATHPRLVAPPDHGWVRKSLAPVAIFLALASALVTFLVLSGLTPILPTHQAVVTVLLVNAALVALLLVIVAYEVWQVMQARRLGRAASRLHTRIVGLFCLVSAVPVILLAAAASFTLDRGLDRWFSVRAQQIIENSVIVAQAYMREHTFAVRSDLQAMSTDVTRARVLFDQDRTRFRQFLTAQASVRGLPIAHIVRGDLTVIERADLPFRPEFTIPPATNLAEVGENEPAVAVSAAGDYVAAVVKLSGLDNAYLYVVRPINPQMAEHLRATQAGAVEYRTLEMRRLGVQVAFALMYAVIAMIVLLSAVLIGLAFANRLVAPIRRLIGAAQVVATGNLYVHVPARDGEGDLGQLASTFNTMTRELRTQRDDIMQARDVLDQRRRFTEAVLSGVSAGVIGVDEQGRVTIMNRTAERLTGTVEADALDRPLGDVVPELSPMIAEARHDKQRLVSANVTVSRAGRERQLSVRMTSEQSPDTHHGYVVTLDDITALVSAQRTSAWADVARRIAHEIKNPLTPIQLSAERLKRKYSRTITTDRDVFEQCTDTIVRQVDDIKRMVDEFSAFARMPKPVIGQDDLAEVIKQVVFLMRVAHPDITFEAILPADRVPASFDRRLISQALTNIVKNATEGIAALPTDLRQNSRIDIRLEAAAGMAAVDVIDSGIGFPRENRARLLEPYVTTREKGTGLGLAIVGKILEEHGGGLELNDAPAVAKGGHGAWVRLKFRIDMPADVPARPAPEPVG